MQTFHLRVLKNPNTWAFSVKLNNLNLCRNTCKRQHTPICNSQMKAMNFFQHCWLSYKSEHLSPIIQFTPGFSKTMHWQLVRYPSSQEHLHKKYRTCLYAQNQEQLCYIDLYKIYTHHKSSQNIWKITFSPVPVCLQQLLNTISVSSKDGTFSLLSSASKSGKCLKIKASVGSVSGQAWTALVQLHKFKVMGNFWLITSRILLHFSVTVPWKSHKK